ncbi:hypothetical protein MFIFM68171_05606 [Madurella fahalii]|uniref:FAD-binding FR-type domain-containing protein n=1 Tax=Madurella fahalii TaxID=1157608 RepID=A0ABQ0GCB9_9PEZI
MARLARIVKTSIRRANVIEIGDGYVRVDIDGVRWGTAPGRHVYVHFPTIKPLRPWESHPFSVLPTSLFHGQQQSSPSAPGRSSNDDGEVERHESNDIEKETKTAVTTAGLTLFIRKSSGMTKSLPSSAAELLTLMDGPYPNKTSAVLSCDRVVLIAGGIGITGVLPWIDSHPSVKLAMER